MRYEYMTTREPILPAYGRETHTLMPPDQRGWRLRESNVVEVSESGNETGGGSSSVSTFTNKTHMLVAVWELAHMQGNE